MPWSRLVNNSLRRRSASAFLPRTVSVFRSRLPLESRPRKICNSHEPGLRCLMVPFTTAALQRLPSPDRRPPCERPIAILKGIPPILPLIQTYHQHVQRYYTIVRVDFLRSASHYNMHDALNRPCLRLPGAGLGRTRSGSTARRLVRANRGERGRSG